MRRLAAFFNSMTGRIFVILAFGIAISGSAGLALADAKRRADLERLHLERAADRLQDFVSLLNGAAKPLQTQLAQQGAPGVRLAAETVKGTGPDPAMSRLLATRLTGASDLAIQRADPGTCLSFRSSRRRVPPTGGPDSTFKPPDCWLIGLRLADGGRMRVALDTPPRLVGETRAFDPLYLSVLALAAALLAFLVARMAGAPLRDLAGAARLLGRDLERDPLPETGPAEVRDAAIAFNAMQARLRRTVSERTQMLAAITHDLQTPLTRLRLRVEKVGDPALQERLISDLAAMQALIREGLDLARSADVREPMVVLDLDSMLQSQVEDEADSGRDAVFTGGCGCDVKVRPQALGRCLANLIDNALVYGGKVEVSAERAGTDVVVRIRDHGPGIPEDQLESVFEPMFRLEDSRSRETGGAGLGLTIARTLAEKNNGRLVLRNHPGGGAEAVLTLPAA